MPPSIPDRWSDYIPVGEKIEGTRFIAFKVPLKEFFENEGVEHKKLMTPGQETPPKYILERFKSIVNEFIENNIDNDKLIDVHCTHGVNRTVYLICNYMISQITIEPNDAMDSKDIN